MEITVHNREDSTLCACPMCRRMKGEFVYIQDKNDVKPIDTNTLKWGMLKREEPVRFRYRLTKMYNRDTGEFQYQYRMDGIEQ
jgi:hypothetical protein